MSNCHFKKSSANVQIKGQPVPLGRQMGIERKFALVVPHSRKTVYDTCPCAGHCSSMQTIPHISVHVIQVDSCSLSKVIVGRLIVAHLGGNDTLHAGRERRIAGGKPVVIIKISLFFCYTKPIALQQQSQYEVSLLQYLMSIN